MLMVLLSFWKQFQIEIPVKKKKIIHPEFEKVPPKLKKILTFSKNDLIRGVIFKEILTPKFKK